MKYTGCYYYGIILQVERAIEPPEVKHERLFVVSILGFLVNLVGIYAFQHGHGHSHGGGGHGHSHGGGGHGHSHGGHGHSHGNDHDHSHGGDSNLSSGNSQIMQVKFVTLCEIVKIFLRHRCLTYIPSLLSHSSRECSFTF